MPLKTATPTPLRLPLVHKWVSNHTQLACPLCGKTVDQWESAEVFEIQFQYPMGVGPEGRFVVLACTCGYCLFVRASAMGV
jgi:hypothetical protein